MFSGTAKKLIAEMAPGSYDSFLKMKEKEKNQGNNNSTTKQTRSNNVKKRKQIFQQHAFDICIRDNLWLYLFTSPDYNRRLDVF